MATEVTAVGQMVLVKLASADDLSGSAMADFTCYELTDDSVTESAGLTPKARWSEPVLIRLLPGRTGKARNWGTDWIAGVEHTKQVIPETTHIVEVVIRTGSPVKQVPSTNRIRIPGFAVTELSEMHELLVHEFSRLTGTSGSSSQWEFDPGPMREFIRSLSPQQRALLCSYDKPYLVSFISLRGNKPHRPMYADQCGINGPRLAVLANADFSVFSCQKKGHKVILDFHTEYFCCNTQNTAGNTNTPKLLNAIYNSLSISNKRPRRFWLTAQPHEHVVYMSLHNGHYDFDQEGTTVRVGDSVMQGNYIHGIINTAGCWMLLRNFNWPKSRSDQFFSLYIHDYRQGDGSEVVRKLAELGYDKPDETTTRSSSLRKWARWDKNYAYYFFFERLVGIDFYGDSASIRYEPNLHNTHGHAVSPTTFMMDEKSFEKSFHATKNAAGYDAHHKEDSVTIGDSVWRATNLRGMPTAGGWGRKFADCFIFNPHNLTLTKLKESPYVAPPAPIP